MWEASSWSQCIHHLVWCVNSNVMRLRTLLTESSVYCYLSFLTFENWMFSDIFYFVVVNLLFHYSHMFSHVFFFPPIISLLCCSVTKDRFQLIQHSFVPCPRRNTLGFSQLKPDWTMLSLKFLSCLLCFVVVCAVKLYWASDKASMVSLYHI